VSQGTLESFTYNPGPADVQKVQFCRRPYLRVRFKNVQLRPAPDPNVKRGTLAPELRGTVTEVGEKEDWKASFQFVPDVTLAKIAHGWCRNVRAAWCSPSGKPLYPTPYLKILNPRVEATRYPYRLALDVLPLQHSVRLRMQTEPPSAPIPDMDLMDYRRHYIYQEDAFLRRFIYLPRDTRTCDIRIGIAGGDFESTVLDAVRHEDGKWLPNSAERPEGKVALGDLEERDGRARLTVVHAFKDADIRALAYGDNDKPLETEEELIRPQPNGTCLYIVRINAAAAAVRRVQIDTRPFQWAVYKGVTLPPAEVKDAKK
jgi:hypothetical protein